MKINFDKTDRLMTLMMKSEDVILDYPFDVATVWKNSEKEDERALYKRLVEITASDMDERTKEAEREKALASVFDEDAGMDWTGAFVEKEIIEELTVAYWQIVPRTLLDNFIGHCTDEKLIELFSEFYPPEGYPQDAPFANIIVKIIKNQEPNIKDVESEFWNNCPDVEKINAYCNIYRERWRGKLLEDMDFTRYHGL